MTTPEPPSRATPSGRSESVYTRPVHARTIRTHRVRRTIALILTGAFVFAASGAGALYYKLQNNITTVDLDDLTADVTRPPTPTPDPEDPNAGRPLNILVIGSDDRSGANAEIGGEDGGMRSDTTIVMHISADRSRVELVSIPRDSLVDLPACETTNGTVRAQYNAMFNSAFALGWDRGGDIASAVSCTRTAVEALTNVYIDGFVVVDFAGFQTMVDAIGGVPINIPETIDSPDANLHLEPGQQTLNGQQALGLARARKGEGLNGSDLTRIERQQDLLEAMANEVLTQNVLTDTPDLLKFLSAATASLTASPELASLNKLTGIAFSLRHLSIEDLKFSTIPVMDAPSDKNRVVWTSEATLVWERMAADQPIDGSAPVVPVATTDGTAVDPTDGTAATP